MALGGMGMGSFIDGLYQTYMGRPADAEGRSFWENSGLSEDQLIAQFSSAPDARQNYVKDLYGDYLGRDADQEGLNYWSGSGMDEAALRDAFSATPDARRYDVAQLYQDYFGRDADQAGLDYWSNSGMDTADIQRAFYDSPEAQTYLASQQQNGPYQAWMQPLADIGRTRSDLETMAEIYRQFKGDEYAAGMLGGQYTESRNNPTQMQLDARGQPIYKGGGPIGYGINQLSAARQADLKKFAEQYGFDPNSAEGQARFHVWESMNTERGAFNRAARQSNNSLDGWARSISKYFIRPGAPKIDERVGESRQFLDWIRKGMPGDDPRMQRWNAPYGPAIQGTPPDFLPGFGGEKYDPDYSAPLTPYTPGPGSSYQGGQTLDPITGQWTDFGSVNMGMQLQQYQPTPLTPDATASLNNIFQPTTIASSSGAQGFGTPGGFLSDPSGSTGSWVGPNSPSSFGPIFQPSGGSGFYDPSYMGS